MREGSGQWQIAHDPEMQKLTAEITALVGPRGRRYPQHTSPDEGDIVGYLDEKCMQPLVRFHWWQLPPSDRRKLMKRSFLWVSFWDVEKRRELVWLPTTLKCN
jgi:hypothetical protein